MKFWNNSFFFKYIQWIYRVISLLFILLPLNCICRCGIPYGGVQLDLSEERNSPQFDNESAFRKTHTALWMTIYMLV